MDFQSALRSACKVEVPQRIRGHKLRYATMFSHARTERKGKNERRKQREATFYFSIKTAGAAMGTKEVRNRKYAVAQMRCHPASLSCDKR